MSFKAFRVEKGEAGFSRSIVTSKSSSSYISRPIVVSTSPSKKCFGRGGWVG